MNQVGHATGRLTGRGGRGVGRQGGGGGGQARKGGRRGCSSLAVPFIRGTQLLLPFLFLSLSHACLPALLSPSRRPSPYVTPPTGRQTRQLIKKYSVGRSLGGGAEEMSLGLALHVCLYSVHSLFVGLMTHLINNSSAGHVCIYPAALRQHN